MSQENVEVVRRFLAAMERSFEAYWKNPRSSVAAREADAARPELREVYSYVHPDAEWQTVFLATTARGHLEIASVWDDYLEWVESYTAAPQEITDLGDDRVFAVLRVTGKAKQGGLPMDVVFF